MIATDSVPEIERVLGEVMEAWNRRDAEAFVRLFTRQGEYITGEGAWLKGPGQIGRLVREAPPGPPAAIVGPTSIRAAEGSATVVFRWRAGDGSVQGSRGIVTCVLVRHTGRWLVDRMQNTDEATVA